jgi:hypothetical protein
MFVYMYTNLFIFDNYIVDVYVLYLPCTLFALYVIIFLSNLLNIIFSVNQSHQRGITANFNPAAIIQNKCYFNKHINVSSWGTKVRTLIFSLIFCLYLNMHNMSINIIFVFKKFHGIKKRNSKFETVFLKKFYNLYVI